VADSSVSKQYSQARMAFLRESKTVQVQTYGSFLSNETSAATCLFDLLSSIKYLFFWRCRHFFWLLLLAKNRESCNLWPLSFQEFEHEGHGVFLSNQIHPDICLFGFSTSLNNSSAVSNFDILCLKGPGEMLHVGLEFSV
jgi:hypothetical protein